MIYILTIEGREHLLKETIDSLLKFNISKDKIKPIYGFTEFKNKNCMKTFIEKLLSHYWIGFKCIYFSKAVLKDINSSICNYQHIDNYFRKYIINNNLEKPTEQSICYQLLYHRANGTEKQRKTKDKYIEQQRKILM